MSSIDLYWGYNKWLSTWLIVNFNLGWESDEFVRWSVFWQKVHCITHLFPSVSRFKQSLFHIHCQKMVPHSNHLKNKRFTAEQWPIRVEVDKSEVVSHVHVCSMWFQSLHRSLISSLTVETKEVFHMTNKICNQIQCALELDLQRRPRLSGTNAGELVCSVFVNFIHWLPDIVFWTCCESKEEVGRKKNTPFRHLHSFTFGMLGSSHCSQHEMWYC